MVNKKSTMTAFLIRSIPKTLWAKVREVAYSQNLTIRDYVMEVIKEDVERETNREKTD